MLNSSTPGRHIIYISLGSNIDREHNTRAGLDGLYANFGALQLSSVYESEAVGFAGSHFYNMVVSTTTDLPMVDVCRVLKQIEDKNGRIRGSKKFAPRTLDLDLLLYDNVIESAPYEIPRAEILYNAFVLLPLAELAPEVKHPVKAITYHELWNDYDKSQQKLWPVEFNWSPVVR